MLRMSELENESGRMRERGTEIGKENERLKCQNALTLFFFLFY